MKETKKSDAGKALTDYDIHLFREGNHYNLYDKLGAQICEQDGEAGTRFAVWAPNAESVHVAGDFNYWNRSQNALGPRWDHSGIWEGFIPGIGKGAQYKFCIKSRSGRVLEKADPVAFHSETPPKTASVVWDLEYDWQDPEWMLLRGSTNHLEAPVSIYEVHPGSWRRDPARPSEFLNYRDIAHPLVEHVKYCGFTHVEFMPVMEHPFYGSWGYQITGYFTPTSRHGSPQDFMYLVDLLHQNGIGVILDWVPSHFPTDEIGLAQFDGTFLYEHEDPRKGFHPDWKSSIYNYGRTEVRNFLISNALFWLDKYHIDGLRVDAVASMLYLDYSRQNGEWIPNRHGGRENEEAIDFLRQLNRSVYERFPDVQMIAEESTAWPAVSRPAYTGGLGFGFKWNMGWMHDVLTYFSMDPVHRKYHQHELTFSLWYAFHENFVLPLSHDEVVHGKGALLSKMPGDDWQKFANLRLLLGFMFTHPGKKLLFMGAEFGQRSEWNHEHSLDWHLLQYAPHKGLLDWVRDLNHLYRSAPALYENDFSQNGFEWIDMSDAGSSVISFIRKSENRELLVVCNCTPVVRAPYRVGVSRAGYYQERLNSDAAVYGGSDAGNGGGVHSEPERWHGRPHSLNLLLPPLSILVLEKTEV